MAVKKTTVKTEKPKVAVKTKEVKAVKKVEAKKTIETKAVKKAEVEEVKVAKKSESKIFSGKYFYAVGKRKTSIAQVRIYEVSKTTTEPVVNGKNLVDYFTIERHSEVVKAPLIATGLADRFEISIKVVGGGIMGQAEASRLGVARALIIFDETLKKTLKDLGYLTRDARIVERKKPGKRKARRSPQWAKR
jgi:small subunit ribosomal protein S9